MSYLQTNTHLENLEVVERVGVTLHRDWLSDGKKDDILNVTQFSSFNKIILILDFIFNSAKSIKCIDLIKSK